jgi:peptide/nickel transport system substrate-binding protein
VRIWQHLSTDVLLRQHGCVASAAARAREESCDATICPPPRLAVDGPLVAYFPSTEAGAGRWPPFDPWMHIHSRSLERTTQIASATGRARACPYAGARALVQTAWAGIRVSLIVLCAALLACRNGAAASDPERGQPDGVEGGSPGSGGTLVFAFDGAAVTQFNLDPHKSGYAPHHRVIRSIFDSLVVALPEHRFGPWLAKSWDVSADGLTYTFHLRDDVKFHDDTRFDAQAVKFNLDRIKDPKNALFASSDIGPYESTTVIDDFTARIKLSKPYAAFLANLSKSSLGMVSVAAVEKYGAEFPSHPVGTGPFVFDSLQAGTEIVLVRNVAYRWGPSGAAHAGAPWLDKIVFKNVPEEATRVAVLENGQADAVDLIPPQNLLALRSSPKFHVISGELLNHNYSMYLNVGRDPWKDARVREAFKLSLDIDAAVKVVYLGTVTRAWSPLSPSIFGYDPTLEGSWRPDPAAAARILDDLGWKVGSDGVREKNGKRLTVVVLDTQGNREKRIDLLTIFRHQLRQNGFDLRIDTQPSGSYLTRSTAGDYDLLAGSLFAPDPDVLRRIHSPAFRAAASVSKVDDPELNELLNAGAAELDPQKRASEYARAQRLIVDKTYSIPVYVLVYTVAAANRVRGIAIDVHGFPVFGDAWIHA